MKDALIANMIALATSMLDLWRALTRPASSEVVGIPQEDLANRERSSDGRPARGEQMEIAEYYQWRHL